MKVLVGCEFSAEVRDAFRARGHDAYSCDLLPCEKGPKWHIQDNVLMVLNDGWDIAIFHPPCTHLSVSGARWFKGKQVEQEEALEFIRRLLAAPIPRKALENPVSIISTKIRKPDQIVQPWWFGDDASKKTCLWLNNLPLLIPTNMLPGDRRTRRANQTPSGQNKLGPSQDRWKERSRTFPGIAAAMAEQWGAL